MKSLYLAGSLAVFSVLAHADTDAPPAPPAPPAAPATAPEADVDAEDTVVSVVAERSDPLLGKADSASEGLVGPRQLERRPILRPGELLETVPGVIITQHSGSGKANQYFLRGYNLDHGTDLAVTIDGMPFNMPTHGHGQGYIDLNPLIPELVSSLRYRKGAYNADQGDFSTGGSIDIGYANKVGKGSNVPAINEVDAGNFGRRRLLATGSPELHRGNLVYGVELSHYDGPWVLPEDFRKLNGILRYSRGDERRGFSVTGMAYDGKWNSTDQVPQRAINGGLISRFGNIDPSDGGQSHRYSLSGQWQRSDDKSKTQANAYAIDYHLNLWSNFTYFLDDPVRGDQFEQEDDRRVYGLHLSHAVAGKLGNREMSNTVGFQARRDDIGSVGLYNTQSRDRFNTVRQDKVEETSLAPYFENRIRWTPKFRTTAGVRYDNYRFKVNSSLAANSGSVSDSILSPKLTLAFGPFKKTEFYASAGEGFHSNDARGTTISIDPKTLAAASPVTPLVRTRFAEIGVRKARKNGQSTLSVWGLKSASELLFVGDAGTTEPSRPSRRTGIEFTNFFTVARDVVVDADFALSRGRFTDADPAGSRIPGAIEGVIAMGVSYEPPRGLGGAIRLRYFGPRPLIEDNSVRSSSSALVNASLGYKMKRGIRVGLEVFNLFNSRVSDIDYFYTSRLPGEAAGGVDDVHTHPAESRSIRFTVSRRF